VEFFVSDKKRDKPGEGTFCTYIYIYIDIYIYIYIYIYIHFKLKYVTITRITRARCGFRRSLNATAQHRCGRPLPYNTEWTARFCSILLLRYFRTTRITCTHATCAATSLELRKQAFSLAIYLGCDTEASNPLGSLGIFKFDKQVHTRVEEKQNCFSLRSFLSVNDKG